MHPFGIFSFGALAARGPDGRSAATVEGFSLESGQVGVESHFAAESVKFADEMTFGEAADGWIAGHPGDGGNLRGNKESFAVHSCGSERGLAAGVTAADDNDIVIRRRRVGHGGNYSIKRR